MDSRPNRWSSSIAPGVHRYRGPSEKAKYQNYIGQSLHDLILLGHWLDGDDRPFRLQAGQTGLIRSHFAHYTTGSDDESSLRTSLPTAGHVQRTYDPNQQLDDVPLLDWTLENDQVASLSGTETSVTLTTDEEQTSITYPLYVEEPAPFMLRVLIEAQTPSHPWVAIGSPNADEGSPVWSTHELPSDGTPVWIETRIDVPVTQTVRLAIRSHQPEAYSLFQYEPQVYAIHDVEWRPLHDLNVQLSPIHESLTTRVSSLEARLHALRSDI